MNADNRAFLEVETILNRIRPKTYYGRREILDPPVFERGEEKDLADHFRRLRDLKEAVDGRDFSRLETFLKEIRNIDRSLSKLASEETMTVVDFLELKRFVFFQKRIYTLLTEEPNLKEMDAAREYGLDDPDGVWGLLDPRGTGQFFFSVDSDYAVELRKQIERLNKLKKAEIEKICQRLQKQFELPLNGKTRFSLNRSDIRNEAMRRLEHVVLEDESTFIMTYRITGTGKTADLREKIDAVTLELDREERRYRQELKERLGEYKDFFIRQIEAITTIDKHLAFLEFARDYRCSFPEIAPSAKKLVIGDGKNILIEEYCNKTGLKYDRISGEFNPGTNIIIGANMGGKTSALKTTGQLYMLFAMGIPVPADHFIAPLFDAVVCVFRTSEEEGLSGFAMEVERIRACFSTKQSLSLIDEFGSSTNPEEGEAIAAAVSKRLNERESVSIFVTHYSLPLKTAETVYRTGALKMNDPDAFKMKEIINHIDHRLYRINDGEVPKGAIKIAGYLGMPDEILSEATKFLNKRID